MKHEIHFRACRSPSHYRPSKSAISSKLFPLVSGRQMKMKSAPTRELNENKNIVPCIPMVSMSDDKYWNGNYCLSGFIVIYSYAYLDGNKCKHPDKRHANNCHKSSYLWRLKGMRKVRYKSLDYLWMRDFADNHERQRHDARVGDKNHRWKCHQRNPIKGFDIKSFRL